MRLGLFGLLAIFAIAVAPIAQSESTKEEARSEKRTKGPDNDPGDRRTSPTAEAVVQASAAFRLATYADKHKDPLVMIAAAKVLKSLAVRKLKLDPKTAPTRDAWDKLGADMSVTALLERARSYANGRSDVIALVVDIAQQSTRGDVRGPGCFSPVIVPGNRRVFHQADFVGGGVAVVQLDDDGESDLDMIVRDESGNRVCTAVPNGTCRWFPQRTGSFQIEVHNLGGVANRYRLCTN